MQGRTMFILKLAIVFTVSTPVLSRLVKDVCSVPQWEAVQATCILTGKYSDGVPAVTQSIVRISYDFNNTRLVTVTNRTKDGRKTEVKNIYDYKLKILYTIEGESCIKTLLGGPFPKACVPSDANYSWDMTHYGISQGNIVLVWEYRGSQDGVNYIIQTLFDGNPVMEQTYGDVNGVSFFSNTAFVNMTSGIKNPDVFIPPSSCKGVVHQSTQVQVAEKLRILSF